MQDFTLNAYEKRLWVRELLDVKPKSTGGKTKYYNFDTPQGLKSISLVTIAGTLVDIVHKGEDEYTLYTIDDGTGAIVCKHLSSTRTQLDMLEDWSWGDVSGNCSQQSRSEVSSMCDTIFNDLTVQKDDLAAEKNARLKAVESLRWSLVNSFRSSGAVEVGDTVCIHGRLYTYFGVNQLYVNVIRPMTMQEEQLMADCKLQDRRDRLKQVMNKDVNNLSSRGTIYVVGESQFLWENVKSGVQINESDKISLEGSSVVSNIQCTTTAPPSGLWRESEILIPCKFLKDENSCAGGSKILSEVHTSELSNAPECIAIRYKTENVPTSENKFSQQINPVNVIRHTTENVPEIILPSENKFLEQINPDNVIRHATENLPEINFPSENPKNVPEINFLSENKFPEHANPDNVIDNNVMSENSNILPMAIITNTATGCDSVKDSNSVGLRRASGLMTFDNIQDVQLTISKAPLNITGIVSENLPASPQPIRGLLTGPVVVSDMRYFDMYDVEEVSGESTSDDSLIYPTPPPAKRPKTE